MPDVCAARNGEIGGIVANEQSRLTRRGDGAWDQLVVTLRSGSVRLDGKWLSPEQSDRLLARLGYESASDGSLIRSA